MTTDNQPALQPPERIWLQRFEDGDKEISLLWYESDLRPLADLPPEKERPFHAIEYVRVRDGVVATVERRRLEIALGYIKRAANRELPKLPCRVDEMTEREIAIFNVGAAAVGNLQFIARELDALAATAPIAAATQDEAHRCPECGRRMQSDFDPDVGMWYECHECDYREAVSSSQSPAIKAAPPAYSCVHCLPSAAPTNLVRPCGCPCHRSDLDALL